MVIVIATAVPPGLRGYITRWMFELAPGVFAGHISARVRDELWERVCFYSGADGKALMVWTTRNEQRMEFRQHRYDWEPADFDGLTLMARPKRAGTDRY